MAAVRREDCEVVVLATKSALAASVLEAFTMGNSASADDKPNRVASKDLCCHTYIHTYREGDAELPEDPDFPKRLLDQTRTFDFSNQVGNGTGTYIFYPNKDKPKMWVGQYKCLNPGDLLCNQTCSLDAVIPQCAEVANGGIDPAECGLMQYFMPAQPTQDHNSPMTELQGGMAYSTPTNEDQIRLEQAHVASMAQQAYTVATGNVYAHSNFNQRLAFSQNMHRSNLPCTPVMTRAYQGAIPPNNLPYQPR